MLQQYAAELRNLAGSGGLEQRVNELTKQPKVGNLQTLAESLGATKKAKSKAAFSELLVSTLKAPQPDAEDSKVARLAETIPALKAKADVPDAPYDEIEAELRSLDNQMVRDEAITVAKRIGIVRHLNSRSEAIEEIRRKVFEMKRARESIAY